MRSRYPRIPVEVSSSPESGIALIESENLETEYPDTHASIKSELCISRRLPYSGWRPYCRNAREVLGLDVQQYSPMRVFRLRLSAALAEAR
ncbi:hypothetical protein VTN49DRAFT_2530 [Thermomyces lanuginosus]|uniref:uncharacterized protein n=1 Tax=Thermomyces lanuginosus TaxID=5541 RepID=UPI003742122F